MLKGLIWRMQALAARDDHAVCTVLEGQITINHALRVHPAKVLFAFLRSGFRHVGWCCRIVWIDV